MKTIIIILILFLSIPLFSLENSNTYNLKESNTEETRFEAGVIFGYISSTGLFLEYDIDDDLSIRAAGYLVKIDDFILGNIDFTLKNNIHTSKYGEFYLTANAGTVNINEEDFLVVFIGAGLGYKYKMEHGVNFFFELKENLIFNLNQEGSKNFLVVPLPAMGISVDF